MTTTLEWDDSSWTAGGSLLGARTNNAGMGTQTAALTAGGDYPGGTNLSTAEGYDGTSWSTRPSIATARRGFLPGQNAPSTAGLIAGGNTSTHVANTEEFTGDTESINLKTITDS